MNTIVQVTLIICITIITLYVISCFKIEYKSDEGSERLPNFPAPSYPRPPIPGKRNKESSSTLEFSQEDE